MNRHVSVAIAVVCCLMGLGCATATRDARLIQPAPYQTGGPVLPAPRYLPDPEPERVKTVLFATVPPDYLADRADFFHRSGVDGVMMNNLMGGWESDIWQQPSVYTPEAAPGRVIGAANPLFQLCKRSNERCRAAGIGYNSVKVAFSKPLPDWFDDAAWAELTDHFRQCAIFARDAGFRGIALDVEYVAPQYLLTYPAYAAPGYPRERLRRQAWERGYALMTAMIAEFPDMVFWVLPEATSVNEWLANDLIAGMVRVLAERDAPGGLHLMMEGSYLQTRPRTLLFSVNRTNAATHHALEDPADPSLLEYWRRRCSAGVGLWPLGFYREFKDAQGNIVGYSGKRKTFGDRLVGSMADKSENYSATDFRRAYAAARQVSRAYTWIYCHGQVLWRMTPAEKERYRGAESDVLPVVKNLNAYLRVLGSREILDDPLFADAAQAVRTMHPLPQYAGYAPQWWVAGPFAYTPARFDAALPPERSPDLSATYPAPGPGAEPIHWRRAWPKPAGYVDLKTILGKPGMPLAYALAWVESDAPRTVTLRLGTNDYGTVFVNGTRVYRYTEQRAAVADDDSIPVTLPAGRSSILVKCGDAGGVQWGFYLRITDEAGREVPGLRWVDAKR